MAEPVTRFYNRFYDSPVGKIAIVTMDNGHDYKRPNTFSEAAMHSLSETLDVISPGRGRPGTDAHRQTLYFCGGRRSYRSALHYDVRTGLSGRASLGHTVMKRIMDLPFPTVAAINGVALGGGLEIALYCRYRTVHRSVRPSASPNAFWDSFPAGAAALWRPGCSARRRLCSSSSTTP